MTDNHEDDLIVDYVLEIQNMDRSINQAVDVVEISAN